jgi:hypothetical protein
MTGVANWQISWDVFARTQCLAQCLAHNANIYRESRYGDHVVVYIHVHALTVHKMCTNCALEYTYR